MKSGSIRFWFMPCKMKVPGMYGFQMSGAGMLTLEGMTRISLRATMPPVPADAGATVAGAAAAVVAAGAAVTAGASVTAGAAVAAGADVAAGAAVAAGADVAAGAL